MEKLKNHQLFIDNECPMCQLYGRAFENWNWVEQGTVKSYQKDIGKYDSIDLERAQNEIALLDLESGVSFYGVAALTKIVSRRFPRLGAALKFTYVNRLLKILYSFISQNRKVIAPSNLTSSTCRPSFSILSRCIFLIVCLLCFLLANPFGFNGGLSIVGLALVQTFLLNSRGRVYIFEYLGNLAAIVLLSSLILAMTKLLPNNVEAVAILIALGFSFFEHNRRAKLLDLPTKVKLAFTIYIACICFTILYKYYVL